MNQKVKNIYMDKVIKYTIIAGWIFVLASSKITIQKVITIQKPKDIIKKHYHLILKSKKQEHHLRDKYIL